MIYVDQKTEKSFGPIVKSCGTAVPALPQE